MALHPQTTWAFNHGYGQENRKVWQLVPLLPTVIARVLQWLETHSDKLTLKENLKSLKPILVDESCPW